MSMYDEASKRVGSGLYIKLDAGKKRIRILTHPYVSNRPGFKPTDPIRTVFTWIIWNYDEQRVQVLEQGPGLFKQIGAIIAEYGENMPMDCDLAITTTGSGLETKRTMVAVPKQGTMPMLRSLQDGRDWPDLERLTGGVPLERFAKGEDLPELAGNEKTPTHEDAANLQGEPVTVDDSRMPANDDVIIQDLDPDNGINLDDIPFDPDQARH